MASVSVSAADYGEDPAVTVNPGNAREIAAEIPYRWDPAALTVRFSVTPAGAKVSPDPNGGIDYSQPVLFSVTADGLKSVYTVNLTSITPPGFYIEPKRVAEDGIETFSAARTWLATNAEADTGYRYVFGTDDSAVNIVLDAAAFSGQTGVKLALEGSGEERTLQLETGGEISGNEGKVGGGAKLYSGTFVMEGGLITQNKARGAAGGVTIYVGTFNLEGGVIENNITASSSNSFNLRRASGYFNYDSYPDKETIITAANGFVF